MKDSRIDSSDVKSLAKAGGGLSAGRAFIARNILFPALKRFVRFDFALEYFVKEGRNVVELSRNICDKSLFERVLVPPLFGLEDNSRYYSVAMVLKHMLIVGETLQKRIPPLSRGERLEKEVRIEEYKPYTDISTAIVEEYDHFIDRFKSTLLENIGDIECENRHVHPWFGSLNPKEWMIMGAIHQTVHRRQIEAIKKELNDT